MPRACPVAEAAVLAHVHPVPLDPRPCQVAKREFDAGSGTRHRWREDGVRMAREWRCCLMGVMGLMALRHGTVRPLRIQPGRGRVAGVWPGCGVVRAPSLPTCR